MPTAVRSHAKINLGLYIGAPRPDGFHSLATVYQTLELYDVVTVTARPAAATAFAPRVAGPRLYDATWCLTPEVICEPP